MTDHPTLLGQADPPVRKRRSPNGWELALWILGAALLVLAVVSGRMVVDLVFANSDTTGAQTDQATRAAAEILYTLLPGIVTGALLSFVAAIALRAHETNVRRRALVPVGAQAPATGAPSIAPAAADGESIAAPAPTVPRRPQDVAQTATGDYSRFMRPPADG